MVILRSYQQGAVAFLRARRRGLVKAPAGSGKTLMAAGAIFAVLNARPRKERARIGWIANTIEQCHQAWEALAAFPMEIDAKVACAAGAPDMSDRQVLIVDEAHHSTSPLWRSIIDSCPGAVWGFTATPGDEDQQAALMEIFGEMFTVGREEVAANLAKARVVMRDATAELRAEIDAEIKEKLTKMVRMMMRYQRKPFDALWEELWPRVAHRACIDLGIMGNGPRNEAIMSLGRQHAADSSIILVNSKEHGALLAEGIPNAIVAHSKMGVRKRREAMEGFRNGTLPCLIATSLLDEGADFPRANVLVMACGGKAAGRVEQRTGRVLRAFAGKQEGLIYDFLDADTHPLMARQSQKRQAVYRELGYTIELPTPQMALL